MASRPATAKDLRVVRWLVIITFLILGCGLTLGVFLRARSVDHDLRAAQVASCERTNRLIRDYNHQYELIFKALGDVARSHPDEPVSRAVIAAFQSPGFPLVEPIKCKAGG